MSNELSQNEINSQWAKWASNVTGFRLFESCYSRYATNLEGQFWGRSHFYDASTMRYFDCRIYDMHVEHWGLWVVTTLSNRMNSESPREYTCVVHDILGNCLYNLKPDDCYRSPTPAKKAFERWLSVNNRSTQDEALRIVSEYFHKSHREMARILDVETRPDDGAKLIPDYIPFQQIFKGDNR